MSFFSIMVWAISNGPAVVELILKIITLVRTMPGFVSQETLSKGVEVAKRTGDLSALRMIAASVPSESHEMESVSKAPDLLPRR